MDDRNAPATKGDVADLEQKLEQVRSEVNHGYRDLAERIVDAETRLVKAFYDFAQSTSNA